MAPFSFIASAIISLAGAFPLRTHAETLEHDPTQVVGPDQNGDCRLGSTGNIIPCPSQKSVSLALVVGIVITVCCSLVLLILLFIWRHRVQRRTKGSPPVSIVLYPAKSVAHGRKSVSSKGHSTTFITTAVVDVEFEAARERDSEKP